MIKVKECRYGPMIFPSHDVWIGLSFDLYGEALYHEIEFLKMLVKDGDVVIDAGAHIGSVTIPLAQVVGSEGCVLAFEPQKFLYYMLCGNVAVNNLYNTNVFNSALSDVSGKQVFCRDLDYSAKQNFGGLKMLDERSSPMDTVAITKKIDDLGLNKLDLIKIDVEGMGAQVLRGGEQTIKKLKPFILAEAMPGDPVELAQIIESMGYKWKLFETPYFHKDNFLEYHTDEIRREEIPDHILVSCDMFCYHVDREEEVKHLIDMEFFVSVERSIKERHKELLEHVNDSTDD